MRLRLRSTPARFGVWLGTIATLPACTSDLPAPPDFSSATDGGTDGDGSVAVDCASLPPGAVGASFDYTPTASGGDGRYSWTQTGLPAGLELDSGTGRISGTPQSDGSADVVVTVTDGTGATAMATCSLDVNPRLALQPLDLEDLPVCARAGDSLLDFVVEGTGNAGAIACDAPGGTGNGKLPDGVTVDPEDCTISGTPPDDRLGTWVFMMRGEQAGATVWLPFCVTNDEIDGYAITVDHSGLAAMGTDATLLPITRTFDPNGPIAILGPTDAGPRVEVVDASACAGGNTCYFGFAYGVNAAPLDVPQPLVVGAGLLYDETDEPVGMQHDWDALSGAPVPENFRDRPFVLNVDTDYCLSSTEIDCKCTDAEPDCDAVDKIRMNGNGSLQMSLLMIPAP